MMKPVPFSKLSRIAAAGLFVIGSRAQLPRRSCAQRPSATLEAIKRSDTAAFEIAGRCMMRLVPSSITRRSPRTPTGATLLTAFSVVHADGPSNPMVDLVLAQPIAVKHRNGVHPQRKPNSRDFALMANLSSQVAVEDTPHRNVDTVLPIGLRR